MTTYQNKDLCLHLVGCIMKNVRIVAYNRVYYTTRNPTMLLSIVWTRGVGYLTVQVLTRVASYEGAPRRSCLHIRRRALYQHNFALVWTRNRKVLPGRGKRKIEGGGWSHLAPVVFPYSPYLKSTMTGPSPCPNVVAQEWLHAKYLVY